MDEKSAQTYNFKHAIIATGSRPIEIPNFEFGERVIDSTGALNCKKFLVNLLLSVADISVLNWVQHLQTSVQK